MNEAATTSWPQIYLGVAFTTLATLILELALTRIFSVIFYYHFAFLAISIALFGLGVGGILSYLVGGWRSALFGKLGLLAAANSVAVVCSLAFLITRHSGSGAGTLALIYFASAVPFVLSGMIVSLAVAETIARVDRVYFFDLAGAAAGCLLLIPLLNFVGGPNTVVASSVFFAVSSAIWFHAANRVRARAFAVGLALVLTALVVFNNGTHKLLDITYAKGGQIKNEIFSKWNSFSRVGLIREPSGFLSIVIDADAATGVAQFNWEHLKSRERYDLLHQGPGLPYAVRPGAKTLIIGPGGGWDVSRALASGSRDITGVEINPIIATTIMRQRYANLSDNLYHRPEVHIYVEDGRSFVRRSHERYQVLQATLVDTWASTAAGAFALSENNLYTTDAFYDYLTHLTDDGLLSFTRWGFDPPRESLRLLSLAMTALAQLGENDPAKHVVVIRENADKLEGWGAQDTVLIFRKPASAADLARLRAAVAGTRVELLYEPGDPATRNEFARLLLSPDPHRFWNDYQYDVSPVSDDRPFFFYTVQPRDIWDFITQANSTSADYKINRALPLLFGLVGISIVATLLVLALPPLLLGTRLPVEPGLRTALLYFVCIGAGYILIQVALIQKFILFLGHPAYALTVIIFSMLVSSGVGSYFSKRIAKRHLSAVLAGIAVLVAVVAFAAAPIGRYGVGLPLPLKMLITVALIAPAGFLMGMPFPAGLSTLERQYPNAVRWAWALNAAASVMGSAGAILCAIYAGLRVTVLIGGALYVAALLVSRRSRPEPEQTLAGVEHPAAVSV